MSQQLRDQMLALNPAIANIRGNSSSDEKDSSAAQPESIVISIRSSNWERCTVQMLVNETVAILKKETMIGLKLNPNEIEKLDIRHDGKTLEDDQVIKDLNLTEHQTLSANPVYISIKLSVDIFCMLHHGFNESCEVIVSLNSTFRQLITQIETASSLTYSPDCSLYYSREKFEGDRWSKIKDCNISDGDQLEYKHNAFIKEESACITMIDAVIHWIAGCMDSREYHSEAIPVMEPIARTLLCGAYDDDNILSHLRGPRYILKEIWDWVGSKNVNYWQKWIKTDQAYTKTVSAWNPVAFPPSTGININMMPFIMSRTFRESKLPLYMERYWHMINACINSDPTQIDKIGYVSIQESAVEKGNTQRRSGLHTETAGSIYIKGEGHNVKKRRRVGWGGGFSTYLAHKDGLYIASNVDDSCAIWNCKIVYDQETGSEIIGELGNVEHLRTNVDRLATKTLTKKGEIYWITDRTPHESLAFEENVCRQFFRLVTSQVSIWYEEHSTANPNGVVPDTDLTEIISGSKFT